jgi:hypothetical protein
MFTLMMLDVGLLPEERQRTKTATIPYFPLKKSYIHVITLLDFPAEGGNSQSFFGKFVRFFLTLRCFYGVVIHRK